MDARSDPQAKSRATLDEEDLAAWFLSHNRKQQRRQQQESREAVRQQMDYEQLLNDFPTSSPFVVCDVVYALETDYEGIQSHFKTVHEIAHSKARCRACTVRAKSYAPLLGRNGALFLEGVDCSDPHVVELRRLACQMCDNHRGSYSLKIIEETTFKSVNEGKDEAGNPYRHWTVVPDQVTSPEMARRLKDLKNIWTSMDGRLSKLLDNSEARASVRIMEEVRKTLQRPDHWGRVLKWVMDIQAHCSKDWPAMSEVERWAVRVFALATGAVEGSVHLDFHQSSNIVDFMELESREALRQQMDARSDPAFYQVSQLNRRLAAQGVTSDRTIGLSWDGKYPDDLDLHVIGLSGECYWNNKTTRECQLDFDANISYGEAEPCENVSCNRDGDFRVLVNNFTRRTPGPVPFTVVIREKGLPDKVIEEVWPSGRLKGDKMEIVTHCFTVDQRKVQAEAVLSTKGASRIEANDPHWQNVVGDPRAFIATEQDLADSGCQVILCSQQRGEQQEERHVDPEAKAASESAAVTSGLMAMMSNARAPKGSFLTTGKKKLLSEHCAAVPTTLEELVALLIKDQDKGKKHDVCIEHRDYSPGYLVDIKTKTDGVRKSKTPVPCHFQRKFELPVKPTSVGNARMDNTWGSTRPDGKVAVRCVTKIEGIYFFVIEGAKLPPQDNMDFPMGGGFYPTDLTSECHVHRERWGYYHSQLKPTIKERAFRPSVPLSLERMQWFISTVLSCLYV